MRDFGLSVFMLGLVTLGLVLSLIAWVQQWLAYGTAYRLTRAGGDDGLSLYGWLFLMRLAALVPGLGFYLWWKYRYV